MGLPRRLIGLVLGDKAVIRDGMDVLVGGVLAGVVAGCAFWPTLSQSIALALMDAAALGHTMVELRCRCGVGIFL